LQSTAQALFLIGSREQVCKAERIIYDIEERLEDPKEKTIFWYTCKHAQANDVADILERIYLLMTNSPCIAECPAPPTNPVVICSPIAENNCGPCFDGPIPPPLVVNPEPVFAPPYCDGGPPQPLCTNFIVDEKSGSIIMVIENDFLPKIKEIVKRLDQPAKMVQIEVLLFEKKIHDQSNFGLNLLKIGSQASNTQQTSVLWNDIAHSPLHHGILSFFLSRTRGGGLPAYDLVYNFMLSQDDVQINACPSVTTVNQTCAKIALVEEISINTGVVQFDCNNSCIVKDAYDRAQYGITIEITPTIHFPDVCELEPGEDPTRYITLDTNIIFDSKKPSMESRPDVTRRNIVNQVRVPDGQTVIIGGLRRKISHDCAEKIPFLGEIPGIGKFFSVTKLSDSQTEMFIFITPKIISDPVNDFYRLKCEELRKRPGDTPAFLRCVAEAMEYERCRTFSSSMNLLFGKMTDCFSGCWAPDSTFVGY
jgi:general secretion pathway protein D